MIGTKARKSAFTTPPLITTPPIVPAQLERDPAAPRLDLAAVLGEEPAPTMRGPSFLDRLDAATGGRDGAGAFLRAAGALFDGEGLGGAIRTGTGYMDEQKAIAAKQAQLDVENQLAREAQTLREQAEANRDALGWAGVGVDVGRLGETRRSNVAREGIDANGQRIQLYGIDTNAATTRRGQDVNLQANREDNATAQRGQDLNHDASIYGTNLQYLGDAARAGVAGAGIASKAYTESKTKIPGMPASNGWFGWGATDAVPEQVITTRTPLSPMAAPAGGDPPQQAIEALKANPNLRGQFDAKYGAGKSAQYLGGR